MRLTTLSPKRHKLYTIPISPARKNEQTAENRRYFVIFLGGENWISLLNSKEREREIFARPKDSLSR